MSKRKQILLILAAMAVLLAALGILLGMVLSSDQPAKPTGGGGHGIGCGRSFLQCFSSKQISAGDLCFPTGEPCAAATTEAAYAGQF